MSKLPDYRRLTDEGLLEALNSVDSQEFPERYMAIKAELQRRENSRASEEASEDQAPPVVELLHIDPGRAATVSAVLYGALLSIWMLILIPVVIFSPAQPGSLATEKWLAVGTLVFLPPVSAFFGGLMGFVGALLYNVLARQFGGYRCRFLVRG